MAPGDGQHLAGAWGSYKGHNNYLYYLGGFLILIIINSKNNMNNKNNNNGHQNPFLIIKAPTLMGFHSYTVLHSVS